MIIWTESGIIYVINLDAGEDSGGSSKNTSLIIGISVGCAVLVIALIGAAIYAVKQKRTAQKAVELSRPFGNLYS